MSDPYRELCPNCVTPWKCNGPHEPRTPDKGQAEDPCIAWTKATNRYGGIVHGTRDGQRTLCGAEVFGREPAAPFIPSPGVSCTRCAAVLVRKTGALLDEVKEAGTR